MTIEQKMDVGRLGSMLALDLPFLPSVSDVLAALDVDQYPVWWPDYLRPPDVCPKCGGNAFHLDSECTAIHSDGVFDYAPVLACNMCDWRRRRSSVES